MFLLLFVAKVSLKITFAELIFNKYCFTDRYFFIVNQQYKYKFLYVHGSCCNDQFWSDQIYSLDCAQLNSTTTCVTCLHLKLESQRKTLPTFPKKERYQDFFSYLEFRAFFCKVFTRFHVFTDCSYMPDALFLFYIYI